MPQKASAKRRENTRLRVRRWRKRHRCLDKTEIEARLRELGGTKRTITRIETVSLDDPMIAHYVDKNAYRDWLQEAS